MLVRLSKQHIHGTDVLGAGDTLDVRPDQAAWLVGLGVADYAETVAIEIQQILQQLIEENGDIECLQTSPMQSTCAARES